MNVMTLVRVLFRLTGLWLWWLCAQVLLLTIVTRAHSGAVTGASILTAAVYLVAGVATWHLSGPLAKWLVGNEPGGKFSGEPIQFLKIIIIGCGLLLITLDAVSDAGVYVRQLAMASLANNHDVLSDVSIHLVGLIAMVKIALGSSLIHQSPRMARALMSR